MEEKKKLPHIGARTIKSGITVFLCSIISLLVLKRESPFITCFSGFMCLQNNIENSVNTGKNRILGTVFGAVMGFVIMFVCQNIADNMILVSLIAGLGIIATIYMCVLFSIENCIATSCMMFLIIVLNIGQEEWFSYSIIRTIDTFVGVLVGITINSILFQKSFRKVKKA